MFLKVVRLFHHKVKSITQQLTLLYGFSTFVLFSLIALFLYRGTVNIIYKADQQFADDEIEIIQNLVRQHPNNLTALRQEIIDIPNGLTTSVYRYYVRVLDKQHRTILETPRMATVLKGADFFEHPEAQDHNNTWWWSDSDEMYYLRQVALQTVNTANTHANARTTTGTTTSPTATATDTAPAWIQVAVDVTYQETMLYNYRNKLFFVLLLGTLIATLQGLLIARRGMKSLSELTVATKNITTTSLHQRIDPQSWPSELSNLGLAFNAMLNRIEDSFSRLNQFSDDLAHELRNPINNLMNGTEVILSRSHSLDEYRQLLESNLEELHRIAQIIDDLLFLARTENPQLDVKKAWLQADEVIDQVCEYYRILAEDKAISVSCEGSGKIMANAGMFKRLISNVLSNALKYTPTAGTIRFTISEQTDGTVVISLTDTGMGIPSTELSKIFNRFYRIDKARAQDTGGVGLGLAIAKSIIECHGGSITISSQIGVGTTITLRFPRPPSSLPST